MKSAHIDTHDLTVALETFAGTSEPDNARVTAALELANLLMLFATVRFDANVATDVREKLDAAVMAVEQRFKIDVKSRIVAHAVERHDEERAIAASVSEAFHAIMRRPGNSAYDAVLGVPLKLSGPDDPEKHLFEPILTKRGCTDEQLAVLRRDASVKGHRFYAAIHRDEDAIGYIRADPNGARQRLKHLFALFRMQFAEHRVVYDALATDATAGAFCYFPLGSRLELLTKVHFEHADLKAIKAYRDLLRPHLVTTALPHGRELCRGLEVFPLPPTVGTVLETSGTNRSRFIEAVFAYRSSDDGKRVLEAISAFGEADEAARKQILKCVTDITGTIVRGTNPEDGTLLRAMYVSVGKGTSEAYKKFVESANPREAIAAGMVAAVLHAAAATGGHFEKILGKNMMVGSVLARSVAADARAMADQTRICDLFRS